MGGQCLHAVALIESSSANVPVDPPFRTLTWDQGGDLAPAGPDDCVLAGTTRRAESNREPLVSVTVKNATENTSAASTESQTDPRRELDVPQGRLAGQGPGGRGVVQLHPLSSNCFPGNTSRPGNRPTGWSPSGPTSTTPCAGTRPTGMLSPAEFGRRQAATATEVAA